MSIEELSVRELNLNLIVTSMKGTIEEKEAQIMELKLPEEFKKIHQEYTKLSIENTEALKRALFLHWFSISEPFFLTGMNELDSIAKLEIIKIIDHLVANDKIDSELNWMLCYYREWDFIFEEYKNYKDFYRALMNSNSSIPKIKNREMSNRGIMGVYWNSLNTN
jgi:hypothetical protein